MKNNWILILVVLIALSACSEESGKEPEKNEDIKESVKTDDVSKELDEMKALYGEIVNGGPGVKAKAQELYNQTQDFVNKNPHHEKAPAVLEISAMSADVLGKYEEAVNILHKLITEYPETEDTPKYMWNKAMIIEEKMGKISNAKAAYGDLILRFPNDPLAKDAQLYIENFLGKSQEEQFEFLDSVNAK